MIQAGAQKSTPRPVSPLFFLYLSSASPSTLFGAISSSRLVNNNIYTYLIALSSTRVSSVARQKGSGNGGVRRWDYI